MFRIVFFFDSGEAISFKRFCNLGRRRPGSEKPFPSLSESAMGFATLWPNTTPGQYLAALPRSAGSPAPRMSVSGGLKTGWVSVVTPKTMTANPKDLNTSNGVLTFMPIEAILDAGYHCHSWRQGFSHKVARPSSQMVSASSSHHDLSALENRPVTHHPGPAIW